MAKFANTKGLSKQEKFMVQGMLLEDNSIEDIAKYLDREVELVEGFMEDIKTDAVETQESPEQKVAAPTQHIINKTGKGNQGVAVMTPAGAQQGDEAHKRHSSNHNAKNEGYTHKIK